MRKYRSIETTLMRAEILLDGVSQHLGRKHPDSCVLDSVNETLGCVRSSIIRLRNKSGNRQWTFTTGARCTWMKQRKKWIMNAPEHPWKCEKAYPVISPRQ